jgi:hypothetical protein
MVARRGKPFTCVLLNLSIWNRRNRQRAITITLRERELATTGAQNPQRRNLLFPFVVAAAAPVAFCARGLLTTLLMSQPPGQCPSTSAPTTSRNTQLHDLHFSPCTVGLVTSCYYCCSIQYSDNSSAAARQKESCSVVDHYYYGCSIDSAPRQFIAARRRRSTSPPLSITTTTPPLPPPDRSLPRLCGAS